MSSDSLRNNNEKFWLYSPCAKKLDVESGEFRDATNSEVFKCCAAKCKPKHEFCKNLCHQDLSKLYNLDFNIYRQNKNFILGRCLGNCRVMNVLCGNECLGLTPDFSLNNSYYDCARQNGCPNELGELPTKECVEKNKDVIFNCCRSNCNPTGTTDCQELCETLQQTILDPSSLGLPSNPYPWADALQNKSKVEINEGQLSHPQEHQREEQQAIEGTKPFEQKPDVGNIYTPLLIALGCGIGIASCIILGVYLYGRKHK